MANFFDYVVSVKEATPITIRFDFIIIAVIMRFFFKMFY